MPPGAAPAEASTGAPHCFATGGIEICHDTEGLFFAPPRCELAYNVQLYRTARDTPNGPLQVFYHSEPRKVGPHCENGFQVGDSIRSGRVADEAAVGVGTGTGTGNVLRMPPSRYRIWGTARNPASPLSSSLHAANGGDPSREASGGGNPMVVSGRDWAGEPDTYMAFVGVAATPAGLRHVLLLARTRDFERWEIWSDDRNGRQGWRPSALALDDPGLRPVPVEDRDGRQVAGACADPSGQTQGLIGSINVVGGTYRYFYTDIDERDCSLPPAQQRMSLLVRTSEAVGAARSWSPSRRLQSQLPSGTLVRVAKARDADRWAVAYNCYRAAPDSAVLVADLCIQYTRSLDVGEIARLQLFQPQGDGPRALRSGFYLGLLSGGDGHGVFGREQHDWMTDRYGNLDVPAGSKAAAGLLTWLDRTVPNPDGSETGLYGRPVFWATWRARAQDAAAPEPR